MYRELIEYLKHWKNKPHRKPLILRGARQTGKTYLVRQFARQEFKQFIEVNFERDIDLCDLFKKNDVVTVLSSLEIIFNKRITLGDTLLFFDEIQVCPAAIAQLRYFYEQKPGLHLVAAGSLLDFTLREFQYSMPVGRVEFAYLYPMNFYEFLKAIEQENLLEFLQNFDIETTIPEPVHSKALQLLALYYLIGGMPEAVSVYKSTGSLKEVENVHESILTSLQYDFAKYGTRKQQEVLIKLLRYLPKALGRKFKYVSVDKNLRSDEIRKALFLMEQARIVNLLYHTSAQNPPLEYSVNSKIFKPVFLDIGLANHLLHLRLTSTDILLENRGALAEQFVAQQLLTLPPYFEESRLFYWQREKRNAEAELDILTEINDEILPIEIKSGKEGRLKSLQIYMLEKNKKFAVRFYTGLPSVQEVNTSVKVGGKLKPVKFKLLNLPLYLALNLPQLVEKLTIS